MAQKIKEITAKIGMATPSVANTNRDGTGTLVDVLTGSSFGNFVDTIVFKATGTSVQGIVRIFIEDASSNKRLLLEQIIAPIVPSATKPTYCKVLELSTPIELKAGWKIKASVDVAQSINVFATGYDWVYPPTESYKKNTAACSMQPLTVANSNRDGTGTLSTLLTASNNGNVINRVNIKATGNTSSGVIRFYIEDNQGTPVIKLFREVIVEATTITSVLPAYSAQLFFGPNGLYLPAGWKLRASTEKADSFRVIVESMNWQYSS